MSSRKGAEKTLRAPARRTCDMVSTECPKLSKALLQFVWAGTAASASSLVQFSGVRSKSAGMGASVPDSS